MLCVRADIRCKACVENMCVATIVIIMAYMAMHMLGHGPARRGGRTILPVKQEVIIDRVHVHVRTYRVPDQRT